jgi:hypothetical protein
VTIYKDEVISTVANVANVAQFVSFGPDEPGLQRYSLITGSPANRKFDSIEDAVAALLLSANSVNIRSFRATNSRGCPFYYGLRAIEEVRNRTVELIEQDYYVIVNETIDVHDGGVSGVVEGGVIEFAPGSTPRAVDSPGIASLPAHLGVKLIETVYGFTPALGLDRDTRVEFSVHPRPVGYRNDHTIIWESRPTEARHLTPHFAWPNQFSRFIGDKAYGLLIASIIGLPVPHTTVTGRSVRTFNFGTPTGSGEIWMRTCPPEPLPGLLPTTRGWSDPFKLLAEIDPDGIQVASILSQAHVPAVYSGAATLSGSSDELIVEGIKGAGDVFMTGAMAPQVLPETVVNDVRHSLEMTRAALSGNVRVEFAHDGEQPWIVQLHRSSATEDIRSTDEPSPARWLTFDPVTGLDQLRTLINEAKNGGCGIEMTQPVGATSHVGELIRAARIPSRISSTSPTKQ